MNNHNFVNNINNNININNFNNPNFNNNITNMNGNMNNNMINNFQINDLNNNIGENNNNINYMNNNMNNMNNNNMNNNMNYNINNNFENNINNNMENNMNFNQNNNMNNNMNFNMNNNINFNMNNNLMLDNYNINGINNIGYGNNMNLMNTNNMNLENNNNIINQNMFSNNMSINNANSNHMNYINQNMYSNNTNNNGQNMNTNNMNVFNQYNINLSNINNPNQNMSPNNMNNNNMNPYNMNNMNLMNQNMNYNNMMNIMNHDNMNSNINNNNINYNNMNQNMNNNNQNMNNNNQIMNNNNQNNQIQNINNNNQNISNIPLNEEIKQQFNLICQIINIDGINNDFKSITKLLLNIIYFDEDFKNENKNLTCSFFQANTKGTFYGCYSIELFKYICKQIKNSGKDNNYRNLTQNYKIDGICNTLNDLKGKLLLIPQIKNNIIKASNFFLFDDYNKFFIKYHFEIIRKFYLYKLLKSQNKDKKFIQLIQNKYPYYLELLKELLGNEEDEKEIINYFKKNTDENINLIKTIFNCCNNHNFESNNISLSTFENFCYKYLIKFIQEGNCDCFRILSTHIAKYLYYLYEHREKNNLHHDSSQLFRNMYINQDEFYNYLFSKGQVICFPSFFSTSLDENEFNPNKKHQKDLYIRLMIGQNNSKSIINIFDNSNNQNKIKYVFLPFSFCKIIDIKEGRGTKEEPHFIYLAALNSEKPIEDMIFDFMINETDNLDPEGLDMLKLINGNFKICINPDLKIHN